MTMATTLARYLGKKQSRFETVRRPVKPANSTATAAATAAATYVPGDRLARTVLLEDHRGYLAAVIPSTHHLKLSELRAQTGRELSLVHGDGVREVFRDCDLGALPPVGMASVTQIWLDDSLLAHADVYFEAGDHEALVHMSTEQFTALMTDAHRGHFAHRMM